MNLWDIYIYMYMCVHVCVSMFAMYTYETITYFQTLDVRLWFRIYLHQTISDAHGVTVIAVGSGLAYPSSNPERGF